MLLNPYRYAAASLINPDTGIASATLAVWLDPSDSSKRSVTSGAINSLTCKKSNVVFSQATTANKPALTSGIFSRDACDFGAATNKWLNNPTGVTVTTPQHIFAVVQFGNRNQLKSGIGIFKGTNSGGFNNGRGAAPSWVFLGDNNTNAYSQLFMSSGADIYADNYNDAVRLPKGNIAVYDAKIAGTMATCQIAKNGVNHVMRSSGTQAVPASNNFTTFGSVDSTYPVNGAFGEILIYNGTLTSGDIALIRNYLKTRWGTP